jgi:3-oxoadipate enol-lactonase
MAQVPNKTYRQAIKCISEFDCRSNLPLLNLPTLLLAGSEDTMASVPMMERLASKIKNAQLGVLANAGHLANLEQATPFNQRVSDFMTQHDHRQGA